MSEKLELTFENKFSIDKLIKLLYEKKTEFDEYGKNYISGSLLTNLIIQTQLRRINK